MFFGREFELKRLEEHFQSNQAELVILYGRRRIGKSSLIQEFIKKKKFLSFEALEKATQSQQINHFLVQLSEQLKEPKYDCSNWRQVFDILTRLVERGEWILCFDEFPWMASRRTAMVSLLKFYWDQKWKKNPGLMLILCGSVSSFMIHHLVHSHALHNRKTLEMDIVHLPPKEVKYFFKKRSHWEIAQIMMTLGGVPKYLEIFNPSQSARINFNKHFFTKDGFFVNELETLFKEQFRSTHHYESIVRQLSFGDRSLAEIGQQISFASGGSLKKYLENLGRAGFVEEMPSVSLAGTKTRTQRYRLADPFLRTYFRFIEPHRKKIMQNRSENLVDAIMGESWYSFFGQAFDWFVYQCMETILDILEIPMSDVLHYGPYFQQKMRTRQENSGVQVDLMLIRKNRCVTLIENKFTQEPVGSSVQDEMQSKIEKLPFLKNYSIEKILISANGATKGLLSAGYFDKVITLEDLF